MDNESFSYKLDQWMSTGHHQLITYIPEGSGVFRLIGVAPDVYQTGFASVAVGSFKEACVSGNWAGTSLQTSFAEAHPTGTPIYEVTRFTQSTPVLNAFNLPFEFQEAIYSDKDLADSEKYTKSHIVLQIAEKYLAPGTHSGVYSPSRRDPDGGVLVYNPKTLPSVEIAYTGTTPPPPEVITW